MNPSDTGDTMARDDWKDPNDLRTDFTLALSAMYKAEVPLYGDLVHIVEDVNEEVQKTPINSKIFAMRYGEVSQPRINIERHGAIRLGTQYELRTIRRIFAIIGMFPIGYYDLSVAGLPMHATCFRPQDQELLAKNPFRVFTSVLRPELIRDDGARDLSVRLLQERDIFTDKLKKLLDLAEVQEGRLMVDQATIFVEESMKTFSWHNTTATSQAEYEILQAEHPVLADIACFYSCHINHLTPRTLNICAAQESMKAQGLMVKARIEGPPPRKCPILLRQTSFLAIEETIKFRHSFRERPSNSSGSHRARFGEIEERGGAVTPLGRQLYDQLLNEAMELSAQGSTEATPEELDQQIDIAFQKYPDDWEELRKKRLVYFNFELTEKAATSKFKPGCYTVDNLIGHGFLRSTPITYEDFLPLSAAGIFKSNLGPNSSAVDVLDHDVSGKASLEKALGVHLGDPDRFYRQMEKDSLDFCSSSLNITIEG